MIIILFLWGTNKACFSKPQPRTIVIQQGFDAQDSTEVQTMTQTGASIGVGANFGPTKPKSKFILKYNLVKSRFENFSTKNFLGSNWEKNRGKFNPY